MSTAGEGEEPRAGEVRTVDRPAPEAFERFAHPKDRLVLTVSSGWLCAEGSDCEAAGGTTWDPCSEDSKDPICRAQIEEAQRRHQEWLDDIKPAEHSEPRVVAELKTEAGYVDLVMWRTAEEKLCGLARAPSISEWAPQLVGECAPGPWSCESICPTMLVPVQGRVFLAALATETADALRVTKMQGGAELVPLEGVPIPKSSVQAVLIDLDGDFWRRIDVYREGRVIETLDLPTGDEEPWPCEEDDCDADAGEVDLDE